STLSFVGCDECRYCHACHKEIVHTAVFKTQALYFPADFSCPRCRRPLSLRTWEHNQPANTPSPKGIYCQGCYERGGRRPGWRGRRRKRRTKVQARIEEW